MKVYLPVAAVLALVFVFAPAHAVDFTAGVMTAVPVRDGIPPTIDGDLGDWDLSAAEPVYISEQSASKYHVEWAMMYDQDALYISARASLPGRPLTNPNEPQDAFWNGDLVQVRIATDPSLPYPLDIERDAASDRTAHLSMWRNHLTGTAYLNIARGLKLDLANQTNPEGTEVAIIVHGTEYYVVEARIPWAALNAPGGTNPYKPGERMVAACEALWIGGDSTRVVANVRTNPGVFAFRTPDSWGLVEFAPQSLGKRRRPTMQAVLTEISASSGGEERLGVPIGIDVPEEGLQLSLNIVSEHGNIIRELVGAMPVAQGVVTIRWDGKDAWGRPLPPGSYKWAAYLSGGLRPEYRGAVGTAGDPPYQTFDGRGGWGGDHSLPLDVATDDTGSYLLWPVSEAGKTIVKIDDDGAVLWRTNPFVGGGFGPFYAIAVDDAYVYLTIGTDDVRLVRLDKHTGRLQVWNESTVAELPLYRTQLKRAAAINAPADAHADPNHSLPAGQVLHADAVGMVVRGEHLYLSTYSQDKVYVIDKATGRRTGEIPLAGPRGLAVGSDDHLYAVSFEAPGNGRVVRLDEAGRTFVPVVSEQLEAPYDVAVGADGTLYVSDLGTSQQIKKFDAAGKLIAAYGKPGGRDWQGKYDGAAFLMPAGLALDRHGNLLIMEAAIPKVVSRFDTIHDAITNRWFGPGVYWNHTWPMPDDPSQVFYTLNDGIGLATPSLKSDGRSPSHYWRPERAGYAFIGSLEHAIPAPETVRAANNALYIVRDTNPHLVLLLKDGLMRPVAMFDYKPPHLKDANKLGKPYFDVWIDRNGDGQQQPDEQSRLMQLHDGRPLPAMASKVGSFHMTPSGTLYFVTQQNSILSLKSSGFGEDGMIRWDLGQLRIAVPDVLPGHKSIFSDWRTGILGVRIDKDGNLYTLFNTTVPGTTGGAFDYVNTQVATQMREGMGHTAGHNIVKFAKFDPKGNLLWMAGRKATAGAAPGEMYHFWNMAGLANDQYIAGGSEWGQIYLYTHDGLFVDALMNNPGDSPPPGPYSFGGETSGGRIAYFPKQDELWAYSTGMAYQVNGFKDGKVIGERRVYGNVILDRVYEAGTAVAEKNRVTALQIVRVSADPLADVNVWEDVPLVTMHHRGSANELATVQLAFDDQHLYARLRVVDDSPQANSADTLEMAFKGGDTAGIVLGPAGERKEPGRGDIRVMAATVGGRPMLIAMKTVTSGEKRPTDYTTPASGTVHFEYVGEIPGSRLDLQNAEAGYTAIFAVPRSFLELDLLTGKALKGDVEVRLSGAGARGLQAVSRQYLFTPPTPQTTMTDDLPIESRFYPEFWGTVEVLDLPASP